jgi:hypothetical protein
VRLERELVNLPRGPLAQVLDAPIATKSRTATRCAISGTRQTPMIWGIMFSWPQIIGRSHDALHYLLQPAMGR